MSQGIVPIAIHGRVQRKFQERHQGGTSPHFFGASHLGLQSVRISLQEGNLEDMYPLDPRAAGRFPGPAMPRDPRTANRYTMER